MPHPPGVAAGQGRFWELHDRLFETQQQWSDLPDAAPTFDSLAFASGAATAGVPKPPAARIAAAISPSVAFA